MTQGVQDSLNAMTQSSTVPQQESSTQLLALLHILQEAQNRSQATLHDFNSDISRFVKSPFHMPVIRPASLQDSPLGQLTNRTIPSSSSDILPIFGVEVSQASLVKCHPRCLCQCHERMQFNTPRLLKEVIGALFVGYSKAPVTSLPCDRTLCGRYERSEFTVVYVFPSWFLQRILFVILSLTKRDGPIMSLRMMNRRNGDDAVFWYTSTGNLIQLRHLFQQNKASPFDIDGQHDISILTVC